MANHSPILEGIRRLRRRREEMIEEGPSTELTELEDTKYREEDHYKKSF